MKIAVVQLNSGADKQINLNTITRMCNTAASNKARLIALPEVCISRGNMITAKQASESIPGETTAYFCALALSLNCWLLLGSMGETIVDCTRMYNTSVLISPTGQIQATYRKLHLFDAKLKQATILESSTYKAGNSPTLATVDDFNMGLSICYDLRFPELYHHYATLGAHVLFVPSSFTTVTGKVHWHTLCKARAIENACYVIAPNQYGPGAREVDTYGHSLIIDPWGNIIAEASETSDDIIYATLDHTLLDECRTKIPTHLHRNDFFNS